MDTMNSQPWLNIATPLCTWISKGLLLQKAQPSHNAEAKAAITWSSNARYSDLYFVEYIDSSLNYLITFSAFVIPGGPAGRDLWKATLERELIEPNPKLRKESKMKTAESCPSCSAGARLVGGADATNSSRELVGWTHYGYGSARRGT